MCSWYRCLKSNVFNNQVSCKKTHMSLAPILLSIAPVFLLILLGNILQRNGIPDVDFWNMNDRLVYWVLMPSLLFYRTSTAEVSLGLVSNFALAVLGGFFAVLAFSLLLVRVAGVSGPVASSVVQGSIRHNSFVALSVAERLFGTPGLSLGALVVSILIPTTNFCTVAMMVALCKADQETSLLHAIFRDLMRNPLILSVVGGFLFNVLEVGEVPVLHESLRLLGSAALPIVLLCVGANLKFDSLKTSRLPIMLSILGKFFVFPLVTLVLSLAVGFTAMEASIALLFSAGSTATASYSLARQMGGDAPLMASIITIQTVLAFASIPAWLLLVQYLFNVAAPDYDPRQSDDALAQNHIVDIHVP